MPGYQHWLPKAYLRGFIMTDGWFATLKPEDMGLSRESLFVARLPNLTDPWECQECKLDWMYANLSEVGGSQSLHRTAEADQAADADLREFGRILKTIRKEMAAQAAGPTKEPEFGGPDDVELPSPVRSLASVVERPEDAGTLLRTIAVGKFRGPYGENLVIRQVFESILTGSITRERVESVTGVPAQLVEDTRLLLDLHDGIAVPGADPRLLRNYLWRTIDMARAYLPDGGTVHAGHSLAEEEEEGLAHMLELIYGPVGELHLLNNDVPWTCDAPFFGIAPNPEDLPVAPDQPPPGFNVGVQPSSGIYLTSNLVDTQDPGAFMTTDRANPLSAVAQWLISPEPLDEVFLFVSSRPWEQPLPEAGSMEEWAGSIYGWGMAPLTLTRSDNDAVRWKPSKD